MVATKVFVAKVRIEMFYFKMFAMPCQTLYLGSTVSTTMTKRQSPPKVTNEHLRGWKKYIDAIYFSVHYFSLVFAATWSEATTPVSDCRAFLLSFFCVPVGTM